MTAANADGIGWTPSDWKPNPGERPGWTDDSGSDRLGAFVVTLVVGTVIALILIGAVTVPSWLVNLVSLGAMPMA